MTDRTEHRHTPVLLRQVVEALNPRAGAIIVDGTFGGGGYSRALLEAAECVVWGIDRDPLAIARGAALVEAFAGRLSLIHGQFGAMRDLLRAQGVTAVDGVVLDLGVSSPQIDEPARGFSFSHDGPLDMRMDAVGQTAADLVNTAEEGELADIIYTLGEERLSRRIARAIVTARTRKPIEGTRELAAIVRSAMPPRKTKRGLDPATRTFQALRIHVNDELTELNNGLIAAEQLLRPGGRLAVVSFHSLEDRRVKQFLRARSGGARGGSRHLPAEPEPPRAPSFLLHRTRATRPDEAEISHNPRSRSARLRTGERTSASAWPTGAA